jgi:hypothetical protein
LKIITYKGKCVKGISSGFFQVLHFFVFF